MTNNTLQEQLRAGIELIAGMFDGPKDAVPDTCPKEVTKAELWELYKAAKMELNKLKSKRGDKPKVQDAVKALLENPDMVSIPIPLIAEIVKTVFEQHGTPCSCSEASVRWYISQNTLKWDIKARRRDK